MAKNAAKKRRRGTAKVTKKLKNTFRYKKPNIGFGIVRKMWDNNLVAEANLARMGLRTSANSGVRPAAKATAAAHGSLIKDGDVARLFDVLDTDDLKVLDRNPRRRVMSHEDQRYTVKLMERYGLDHEGQLFENVPSRIDGTTFLRRDVTGYLAMARDMKINYNQLTVGQVRRMCDTLLSLAVDERVVAIPERVLSEISPGGERGNAVQEQGDEDEQMEEAATGLKCSEVSPTRRRKSGSTTKKKKSGQ